MPKARNRRRTKVPAAALASKGAAGALRGVAVAAGLVLALAATVWALVDFDGPDLLTEAEVLAKDEGDLPDVWLGRSDAPVTIVEYASMGCPHCADFSARSMPDVKRRILNRGLARYAFREFPLDTVSLAAAMLPRCLPEKDYHAAVAAVFAAQETWTSSSSRSDVLFETMRPFGMTREAFDACVDDGDLEERIAASRSRGSDLGVTRTPTFLIGGVRYEGALTADQMEEVVRSVQSRRPVPAG